MKKKVNKIDGDDGGVVLLTGGAGYVGSHTLVRLLQGGVRAVVVDNMKSSSDEENIKPVSVRRVEQLTGKTVDYFNVDISHYQALKNVFQKLRVDWVVHFAALKSVGDSCRQPLDYYRNNVAGTVNLLQVMDEFNVKRLVFSSSATVYGEPIYLPIDEKHPTGNNVTNPYGKTKFFVEEILRDLCASDSEWSVVCLRYFNPVGAHPSGMIGEDPVGTPCNLMPYVSQVASGRRPKLSVYGCDYETPDGTGVRDYIHIMDLAEGHWAAAQTILAGCDGGGGWRAFNLGVGQGYSVLQVVKCFEKASGNCVPLEMVKRRDGDVASCYSDCSLAQSQLQWKATRTLDDMCADMWRWQLMNPNGYAPSTSLADVETFQN